MARIAGVNIPSNKRLEIALTYIYGIGSNFSKTICKATEVDGNKRVNILNESEIIKIREYIDANFTVVYSFCSVVVFLRMTARWRRLRSRMARIWASCINGKPIPD